MYELSWRRIKNSFFGVDKRANEVGSIVMAIMRELGGNLSADRIPHLNEAKFIELRDVNFLIFGSSAPYCNDKAFLTS